MQMYSVVAAWPDQVRRSGRPRCGGEFQALAGGGTDLLEMADTFEGTSEGEPQEPVLHQPGRRFRSLELVRGHRNRLDDHGSLMDAC